LHRWESRRVRSAHLRRMYFSTPLRLIPFSATAPPDLAGCASRRGRMAAMRWVLRIFVKAAAALSVFLLVASIILWVRSYFVGNLIRHIGQDVIPNTSYFISSADGTLVLSR